MVWLGLRLGGASLSGLHSRFKIVPPRRKTRSRPRIFPLPEKPSIAVFPFDELAESGLEVHAIGDCVAPRRANNATYEGRKLGLKL